MIHPPRYEGPGKWRSGDFTARKKVAHVESRIKTRITEFDYKRPLNCCAQTCLRKKFFRGRVAGIITLFNHSSLTRDPFRTEALCIVLQLREIQIDNIRLFMLVTTFFFKVLRWNDWLFMFAVISRAKRSELLVTVSKNLRKNRNLHSPLPHLP